MIVANELSTWWLVLCAATAINIAAWCVSAVLLGKRRAQWPVDAYATRRQLLWLSAAYVLGCGFRSLLPRMEVPHICLHDGGVWRVAVARTSASST